MGKAIRNFKDALSGVEEAKFRKLEEEKEEAKRLAAMDSAGVAAAATQSQTVSAKVNSSPNQHQS